MCQVLPRADHDLPSSAGPSLDQGRPARWGHARRKDPMTITTRRSPTQCPPSAAVAQWESARSRLAAAALPHFYDLTGHRQLLDISDAHGCWSIAAAAQPSLRATVLALPTTANPIRALDRAR